MNSEPNVFINRWVSTLYRQFQIHFNQQMKPEGISSSEYFYLLCLYKEDGLSQDMLTNRLYLDKAATARAVKALEEKGFVTRVKDVHDKRVNRVHLTPKAWEVRPKIIRVLHEWNLQMIDHMEPAQAIELSAHLEFISQKMRRINEHNKEK